MKGSMTVEAACVYPFCFMVIALICFLGVYKYNQAVLKMTGYECILEALEQEMENPEEILKKKAEEAVRGRVLAVGELTVDVKTTATKIALCYKGVQDFFNLPLKVTVDYERTFPEVILRLQ